MQFVKRLIIEIVALALALGVMIGAMQLLYPITPLPTNPAPGSGQTNQYYERRDRAMWLALILWITTYYALRKLYDWWQRRRKSLHSELTV